MSEMGRAMAPQLMFSGVHVGAAGAATSFLANAGPVATAPLLAARPKFPCPAAVLRNLRARATTNPLGAALNVTIMKNGVATALTVAITTGSTALFKDTTHAVVFAADDELDVQLDSTAAGVATALVVVTVEG